MMTTSRRLFSFSPAAIASLVVAFTFLLLPGVAQAQKTLLNHTYKKAGNTRIKVESVFDTAMPKGYMPVRVTIRNGTSADRTWRLSFTDSAGYNAFSTDSTFNLETRSNSEAVHDILVPLPSAIDQNSYSSYVLTANSSGLGQAMANDSDQTWTAWPSIGISTALAARSITPLNDKMRSNGGRGEKFAGKFDPKMLPTDWRGYSGLDALMIQDKEWDAVPAGPRKAIQTWIRHGGVLDIYTNQANRKPSEFGFSKADSVKNGEHQFSFGAVNVKKWDGRELPVDSTISRYNRITNKSIQYAQDFDNDWKLERTMAKISDSKWIVIFLLLAFAVIVGPINLFVFAKPGRRQKLFITTPLISIIASALIFALIMTKDGIGGSGSRITFANLQSGAGEKQLYLRQEQISRTGVLLSGSFEVDESAFITPVRMRAGNMNRLTDDRNQARGKFTRKGNTYAGDWFQSRSEQGQAILAVQPTRSRIELRAPASADGKKPPELFSSLEFGLRELFYRDWNGKVWKSAAPRISPGNAIPLEAAEPKDLEKWWSTQTENFSVTFRNQARKLTPTKGNFFAVSTDPRAGSLDSLKSIRWKDDFIVMTGSVLAEGAAATPGNE
ncbi:hypothetical protein N8615_01190 [Verrucomicrobiales bacterium]|nr:hypothetical protein [Verrucomicrobiales bacterium]